MTELPEELRQRFGARIPKMTGAAFRDWRHEHGWTQAATAALFGVTERTIRAWEDVADFLPQTVALAAAHLSILALDIRRIPRAHGGTR